MIAFEYFQNVSVKLDADQRELGEKIIDLYSNRLKSARKTIGFQTFDTTNSHKFRIKNFVIHTK